MTTTETDNAHRVCLEHLRTLERIQAIIDEFGDTVSTEDLDDIANDEDEDEERREVARTASEFLTREGLGNGEGLWYELIESSLDVEITGRFTAGRWEWTEAGLLVSFGGPTVRYITDDGDRVRIEVAWWDESCVRFTEVSLAGVLYEEAEARVSA